MATCQTLPADRSRTGITVATLNRPDRLNALTFGMFDDLARLAVDVAAKSLPEKRPPAFVGR